MTEELCTVRVGEETRRYAKRTTYREIAADFCKPLQIAGAGKAAEGRLYSGVSDYGRSYRIQHL